MKKALAKLILIGFLFLLGWLIGFKICLLGILITGILVWAVCTLTD